MIPRPTRHQHSQHHRQRILLIAIAVVTAILFPLTSTHAQQPSRDYTALFDKIEVMIPARDGVKLHTEIYAPKNAGADLPILFERTPYGISSATHGYSSMLAPLRRNDLRRATSSPSRTFAAATARKANS